MPVTPERVRELALALEGASAAPHFHRVAFRTPRRIFATLDASVPDLNLMFDADLRAFYCEQAPEAFVMMRWGRREYTRCDLNAVDEPTLASALMAAHRLAGVKKRRR